MLDERAKKEKPKSKNKSIRPIFRASLDKKIINTFDSLTHKSILIFLKEKVKVLGRRSKSELFEAGDNQSEINSVLA